MGIKEILDMWKEAGILPFTSRNTPDSAFPPGRHLIDIIKGNQVQQTTPVRRKYLLETMGISDYSYKLISTTMGYIPPLNQ